MEYFPDCTQVSYQGCSGKEPFSYRFYDPDFIIYGKPMREHLRFAVSWWHTFCYEGSDMFGGKTMCKRYGKDPIHEAKLRVDAAFELMEKLDIDFFCFHDHDLVEEAYDLASSNKNLDEMSDYLLERMQSTGKRCLWSTANLFYHRRYVHGAATAPDVEVFAYAGAQIKKNIEVAKKLDAAGIVFWGGREGYETLLNTDMALELENLAAMLQMARDYARQIGFKGSLYIEPKPKEPTKHQYDFDAAAVTAFLRGAGLEKDYKLNIEANHATLAGHSFQHELRYAAANGLFGSIDANQGDPLLGWDTDQFPTDVYAATLCMLEVLRAGGFKDGGLNFDAKTRRGSFTANDILYAYIAGIDTFALGLRKAAAILEDGRLDQFLSRRYKSWDSGLGRQIRSRQASLETLEQYALTHGEPAVSSGRQEYLENIINEILFSGEGSC